MLKRIVMQCAGVLLLLAATFSTLSDFAAAEFLSLAQQEKQVCYSASYGYVATLSVMTVPPTAGIDAIVFEGVHQKMEFHCMQAFESAPVLPETQASLCNEGYSFEICSAPAATEDLVWTCVEQPQFLVNPASPTLEGAFNEDAKHWKVVWKSRNVASFCFPRDVTVMITARDLTPAEPDLTANIIFILIVVGVICIVLFFVSYQLKKVLNKFMKRDERSQRQKNQDKQGGNLSNAAANRTLKALGGYTDDGAGGRRLRYVLHGDDLEAGEGEKGDEDEEGEESSSSESDEDKREKRRNERRRKAEMRELELYGHTEGIPTRGIQATVLPDSGIVLTSKPMARHWYQRGHYNMNKKSAKGKRRGDQQSIERDNTIAGFYAVPDSMGSLSTPGRTGGTAKRMLNFSHSRSPATGQQARRGGGGGAVNYANMYDDDDDPQNGDEGFYDDDADTDDRIPQRGATGFAAQHRRQHSAAAAASAVDQHHFYPQPVPPQQQQQASVASAAARRRGGSGASLDDDDNEMVLTCLDCMLPIDDANTPRLCGVTGKRHY